MNVYIYDGYILFHKTFVCIKKSIIKNCSNYIKNGNLTKKRYNLANVTKETWRLKNYVKINVD